LVGLGRRPLHGLGGGRRRRRGAAHVTGPDQHVAVLVRGDPLGLDELLLQIVEDVVVQVELAFEGAIGDPAPPSEEFLDVVEQRVEVHHRPPTCASAASAWGSQKVIAMARYS
jgi:hypothetical protein